MKPRAPPVVRNSRLCADSCSGQHHKLATEAEKCRKK